MSSLQLKTINHGAVVVASDLRTGHAVYRTDTGIWTELYQDAQIFTDLEGANDAVEQSRLESTRVIDPYLAATDKEGGPQHLRESIRSLGPTAYPVHRLVSGFDHDNRISGLG